MHNYDSYPQVFQRKQKSIFKVQICSFIKSYHNKYYSMDHIQFDDFEELEEDPIDKNKYKQSKNTEKVSKEHTYKNIEEDLDDQLYDKSNWNKKIQQKEQKYLICQYCDLIVESASFGDHVLQCQNALKNSFAFQNNQKEYICSLCGSGLQFGQTIEEHDDVCMMKQIKCLLCQQKLLRCLLDEHQSQCKEVEEICSDCGMSYPKNSRNLHRATCRASSINNIGSNNIAPDKNFMLQGHSLKVKDPKIKFEPSHFDIGSHDEPMCRWCFKYYAFMENPKNHDKNCPQLLEHVKSLEQMYSSEPLTKLQVQALDYLQRNSVETHAKCRKQMQNKILSVGYTLDDLFFMTQYIQEQAPIIIHFNLSKSLIFFLKDKCYKNMFETNTSGGSRSRQERQNWQRYLFGKYYDEATDSQRIKYGVMNFVNDFGGIKSCANYGSSYLVLNQNVRKRCTITNRRKYGPGEVVSTLKYCYSVLSQFDKKQLESVYYACRGYSLESKDLSSFKQVHIHGPISFVQDVQCIYSPKSEIDANKSVVEQFMKKFQVPIHQISQMI